MDCLIPGCEHNTPAPEVVSPRKEWANMLADEAALALQFFLSAVACAASFLL